MEYFIFMQQLTGRLQTHLSVSRLRFHADSLKPSVPNLSHHKIKQTLVPWPSFIIGAFLLLLQQICGSVRPGRRAPGVKFAENPCVTTYFNTLWKEEHV